MADEPLAGYGGKTPLQMADKPSIDRLAKMGRTGRLITVPEDMHPGSEIANMSVLGYDVHKVFEGRGVLEAARTGGASNNYGNGYELDAIAACVVGGWSVSGGVGTVPGIVIGVLIFSVINYGLTFIGINPYWQQIIKGLIIVSAVAVDIRKYIRQK